MSRSNYLERRIPALRRRNYQITSPTNRSYNCAAWAGGDDSRWWEPVDLGGYYWPSGVPKHDFTVANYALAFEQHGFATCDDGSVEDGIEKIALFEQGGRFCHSARQLEDGRWTSKCGSDHDIAHDTPDDLAGDLGYGYGEIVVYMQRSRSMDPDPQL